MSSLLQSQLDANPTVTADDFSDIKNNSVEPILQVQTGDTDRAILQRLSELEDMIKDRFDMISSKLSNTVVSSTQSGGKRRTKKRRSKQNKIM